MKKKRIKPADLIKLLFSIILLTIFTACDGSGSISLNAKTTLLLAAHFEHFDKYRAGNGTKVLIMGDSRADMGGYWPRLPYTVLNTGWSGKTTTYTISRLDAVDKFNPDYVVIFSGINDARELTIDQFKTNLEYIVKYISDRGAVPIIMDIQMSTTTINQSPFALPFSDYENVIIKMTGYYDYKLPDEDFTTSDCRCHFNRQGYIDISRAIINKIGQAK